MQSDFVLEMNNIVKNYYGNTVLKNVSLNVKPGEIHALIGENGAGKSTLMNILFGMPVIHSTGGFEGSVKMCGDDIHIDTPQKAITYGIGMVHQEFMLIPGFTVTENIKVGREISKPSLLSHIFGKNLDTLDKKSMAQDAKKAISSIGLNVEEYTKVAGMPVGYMQFVEIAREIDKKNIKLLVFDEPTAVLTEKEAEKLLNIMKVISSKGIAIIFITHRLDEVMQVADSMTILRDGEFICRKEKNEFDIKDIARLMIGRKVEKLVDDTADNRVLSDKDIALSIQDLHVQMPGEEVKGIDLNIRKGEIFGIGGLAGQGKVGIPNGIMGIYKSEGKVNLFGKELNLKKLGNALENGIAFVSEDRKNAGLLLEESIEQNIIFSAMQIKNEFLHKFIIKIKNSKSSKKHAEDMIKLLDIRCTGTKQPVGNLSGGNQQKVCLARALTLNPKLLIVSEPTRGIDIGAKKLVLEYLVKLNREQGMTIIIVSSELVELRSLCDRIAIVSNGKLSTILTADAPDEDFGLAMSSPVKGDLSHAK